MRIHSTPPPPWTVHVAVAAVGGLGPVRCVACRVVTPAASPLLVGRAQVVDDSCPRGCEGADDCMRPAGDEGNVCRAVPGAPPEAAWHCSGPWQAWTPSGGGDDEADEAACVRRLIS